MHSIEEEDEPMSCDEEFFSAEESICFDEPIANSTKRQHDADGDDNEKVASDDAVPEPQQKKRLFNDHIFNFDTEDVCHTPVKTKKAPTRIYEEYYMKGLVPPTLQRELQQRMFPPYRKLYKGDTSPAPGATKSSIAKFPTPESDKPVPYTHWLCVEDKLTENYKLEYGRTFKNALDKLREENKNGHQVKTVSQMFPRPKYGPQLIKARPPIHKPKKTKKPAKKKHSPKIHIQQLPTIVEGPEEDKTKTFLQRMTEAFCYPRSLIIPKTPPREEFDSPLAEKFRAIERAPVKNKQSASNRKRPELLGESQQVALSSAAIPEASTKPKIKVVPKPLSSMQNHGPLLKAFDFLHNQSSFEIYEDRSADLIDQPIEDQPSPKTPIQPQNNENVYSSPLPPSNHRNVKPSSNIVHISF